ncbi:MAG: dTDP-4-dehydrorhamnose reductase [Deltaproteobacteria bacterium]|nr:dTDP-4-dehydrorhamnose reductase [Deltaproteobacteria bacterium]
MLTTLSGSRVLIAGAHGMLAGHLIPALQNSEIELTLAGLPGARPTIPAGATDIPSPCYPAHPIEHYEGTIYPLDITDARECLELMEQLRPNWVINAAAYTAVDHAQRDYSRAFEINSLGPKNLAHAARLTGAKLVHISSDYVFGGHATDGNVRRVPYSETDSHAPCGLYGESKRFGDELAVSESHGTALVLRTSWLHGLYGGNFVDTILTRSAELDELRVVSDQFGSPTYAGLLTECMLDLMAQDRSGIFHISSQGGISWNDFAAEITKLARRSCTVRTQTSEELNRPAPRPAYSVLALDKVETTLNRRLPSWKIGLAQHLHVRGFAPTESI